MTDFTGDFGFSDRIARLEAQIEQHAGTVERCRKAMLFAKLAAVGGAIWLVAMVVGAVYFNGLAMVVSLSAVIGGVVFFGSSRSTLLQAATALQEAEAQRNALIGALDLRTIEPAHAPSIAGSRLLH